MMLIPRDLKTRLLHSAARYPVLALLGPRQSGKTTLARAAFPHLPYASLENPDTRSFALEDPRRFLEQFPKGAILDEVQRAPDIFSYLQALADDPARKGCFVLTGSQHFGLMERITQSLAGRVALHKLLPLSLSELRRGRRLPARLNTLLHAGGYPRLYAKALDPRQWFADYVETYLERDVRLIKNIGDLATFHRFLRMVSHRCGQLLNLSSLANDCGISHNTAKSWISILEASFLIFLLPPHYKNFNKRLKKSPKLYFYDTGLLCYLLGVSGAEELATHSMRGAIFESSVLGELIKRRFNQGLPAEFYFWQDKLGREVDCLIELGERVIPVEIKSGQTINEDYFQNLALWQELSKTEPGTGYLVYAGEGVQKRRHGSVIGWKELDRLPL